MFISLCMNPCRYIHPVTGIQLQMTCSDGTILPYFPLVQNFNPPVYNNVTADSPSGFSGIQVWCPRLPIILRLG